jgi:hypothetical protein
MTWALIVTCLGGAAMLALSYDLIVPLADGVGSLSVLAGITSTTMLFGLVDGGQ